MNAFYFIKNCVLFIKRFNFEEKLVLFAFKQVAFLTRLSKKKLVSNSFSTTFIISRGISEKNFKKLSENPSSKPLRTGELSVTDTRPIK